MCISDFLYLENNRMMLFCNLFMERFSYIPDKQSHSGEFMHALILYINVYNRQLKPK